MDEQFLVYQRLIEQYEDRIRKLAMINEEQSLMIAENESEDPVLRKNVTVQII